MKLLIGIFFSLILAFLTSKLKINVLYLQKEKNSFPISFKVKIGFYLFGFVKLFGIIFQEDGFHVLCFSFPYNKLKIDQDSIKILKDFSVVDFFKLLNMKLDKLNFQLKIGSEDMILTVFSVFAISTFLSILSAKNRKQINLKNFYYKITPVYHTNLLDFKISLKISIKISHIIRTLSFIKKRPKQTKDYHFHIRKVPIKI